MRISNPNQIIDTLITDYKKAFGDSLHSVIMYGSALSHEYVPGKSDVNMLVILTDSSTTVLQKCRKVHRHWLKRGVEIPFFMTPREIKSSLKLFPVEIVNIQYRYKMLYGDDFIKNLAINREDIQRQCEHDLMGIVLHLKSECSGSSGGRRHLSKILEQSLRRLMPLLRAIIVLDEQKIPNSKSEVISIVEDIFGIGSSVLSDVHLKKCSYRDYEKCFYEFVKIVEMMIQYINEQSDKEKTLS